ncbi:carbohydrate-binding protein [bacterium]|nr:carbohydrate-binding protein [bacterium]
MTSITPFNESEDLVRIIGCKFIGNFADPLPGITPPGNTEAGAVFSEGNFRVEFDRCYFEDNYAQGGGAIQSYRAHFKVTNSVFINNRATGGLGTGGAISMGLDDAGDLDRREADLHIENVLIKGCTGHAGGGIYHAGDAGNGHQGDITLKRVVIDSCESTQRGSQQGHGGGMFLQNSNVTADQLYLINNTAAGGGGGVTLVLNTDINASNSYLIGNSSNGNTNDVYDPQNNNPKWNNSYFAHNPPGSGGGPLDLISPILDFTLEGTAYLLYGIVPDAGNPKVNPGNISLLDNGAYRAGTLAVPDALENVTYSLSTSSSSTADIAYSRFIPDSSFLVPEPPVPIVLEAEDYDYGRNGVSYLDSTVGNAETAYRTGEQVEIVPVGGASNGHIVGWIMGGEWLEYTFDVQAAGIHEVSIQVASPNNGAKLYLQLDGETLGSVLNVPNTGDWSTWGTLDAPAVDLEEGWHKLRVVSAGGGYNFDSLDIRMPSAQSTGPVLAYSSDTLSFSVKEGATFASKMLDIWNSGGGTLNYQVVDNDGWITSTPSNGTNTGETDSVSVQLDTSTFTEGTYYGSVTIQSDGTNGNQNVNVVVTVRPDVLNPLDFDGDGRADIAVYDPNTNNWSILQSASSTVWNYTWGLLPSDLPVAGDYDGDGLADPAAYQANGTWHLARSAAGYAGLQLGSPGVINVPADYDGDGATDMAIYEPWTGIWHLSQTTLGYFGILWGDIGDIPVPADYDGDGITDFAVFRPSNQTWYLDCSNVGPQTFVWGLLPTDKPVPGDYDGDGIDDIAVYQANGTWHLARTSAGYAGLQLGAPGDIPVPADYDGDGAIDMAIFQPNGVWHLSQTTEGYRGIVFGKEGDRPVKSAPNYQ